MFFKIAQINERDNMLNKDLHLYKIHFRSINLNRSKR